MLIDAEKFYVALSRSRGFSQIVINKEILGSLPDDIASLLKSSPKHEVGRAYYEAVRSQAARLLSRSGEKTSTQHGRLKQDIMKVSVSDRLDNLKKRALGKMELADQLRKNLSKDRLTELERLAKISRSKATLDEKISELAAKNVKRRLRKALVKAVLKV